MGNLGPGIHAIKSCLELVLDADCVAVGDDPHCDSGVHLYSYGAHFNHLWDLVSSGREGAAASDPFESAAAPTLVIVDDYCPQLETFEAIDVSRYLTVWDWLVAFVLNASRQHSPADPAARCMLGRCHICIVTGCDDVNRIATSAGQYGLLARLGLTEMPNVRVYSFARSTPHRVLCSLMTDIDAVVNTPQGTEAVVAPIQIPRPGGSIDPVVTLRNQWTVYLTRFGERADHHSIHNILGPRLLSGETDGVTPDDGARRFSAADVLWELARSLDLVPSPSADDMTGETPAADTAPYAPRQLDDAVDRFVLLDDMQAYGWADFVRRMLRIDPESDRLRVGVSPFDAVLGPDRDRSLLDILNDAMAVEGERKISLTGAEKEILFLDLRFFRSGSRDERDFFRRLVDLAGRFTEAPPDAMWPTIAPADIEAAQRFLDHATVASDDYYLCLSLLPRLLALADPTLPIVLFSSSGRRTIARSCEPYRNIITEFDKPRIFAGLSHDVVWDSVQRFKRACDKALGILRVRNTMRDARKNAACLPAGAKPVALSTPYTPHVAIFIDESGDKWHDLSVGGVMLVMPSESCEYKLEKRLCETADESIPLYWGISESCKIARWPAFCPQRHTPKETSDHEPYLGKLDKIFAELEITPYAFCLMATQDDMQFEKLPFVFRRKSIDNLYYSLLQEILETLLFSVLPQLCEDRDMTVAIDVATKLAEEADPGRRDKLMYKYGINFTEHDDTRYYSLSHDDIHTILYSIFTNRNGQHIPIDPVRARGITLMEFGKPELSQSRVSDYGQRLIMRPRKKFPKQVHYLADWMARIGRLMLRDDPYAKIPDVAREWFGKGFLDYHDAVWNAYLQADRHAAAGEFEDAYRHYERAREYIPTAKDEAYIGRWLVPRLNATLFDNLDSGTLASLFHRFGHSEDSQS